MGSNKQYLTIAQAISVNCPAEIQDLINAYTNDMILDLKLKKHTCLVGKRNLMLILDVTETHVKFCHWKYPFTCKTRPIMTRKIKNMKVHYRWADTHYGSGEIYVMKGPSKKIHTVPIRAEYPEGFTKSISAYYPSFKNSQYFFQYEIDGDLLKIID